jgi:hypothetical protein
MPQQEVEDGGRIGFLQMDGRHSLGGVKGPLGVFFSEQNMLLPSEGTLLIFPSFLQHFVNPNASDSDRISAAFNLKFVRK